jgi:hypothetical protein
MRLLRPCAGLVAALFCTVAFLSTAEAQKIRSYGDTESGSTSGSSTGSSGGGSAQGWYPGMPVEQQSNDSQQANTQQKESGEAGEEGEEGDEGIGPSHRITMFTGKKNSGPRTTLDLTLDKLYRGIIPGTRDEVEHLSRLAEESDSATNQLTWLGFHPTDEHTRVFFQTSKQADYDIKRRQTPPVIEIELNNAQISSKNFSRFIDTSFFNRNVKRVEAKRSGKDKVTIVIELESFEQPSVRRDGKYVYLDFPYQAPAGDGEQVADTE